MRRVCIFALIAALVVGIVPIYAQQNLGLRVITQSAVTTGNGTAVDVSKAYAVTIYCDGAGTISGGVITVEEARDTAYSGTWSTLTTITASALTGGADAAVHMTSAAIAVRTRISSTITGGGTVTCEVLAN